MSQPPTQTSSHSPPGTCRPYSSSVAKSVAIWQPVPTIAVWLTGSTVTELRLLTSISMPSVAEKPAGYSGRPSTVKGTFAGITRGHVRGRLDVVLDLGSEDDGRLRVEPRVGE